MQRRPTILHFRAKELDALPSLTGPAPTAGRVFDDNGWSRSLLARQPWEEEHGDDEPTEPAHGETLDDGGLPWRKVQP